MFLGRWEIDDLLSWAVNTHTPATGAAVDGDSAPTYRVYEDETGTAILTGTMALLDDANTTGQYSEQITLSAANGFEVGKSYTIRIAGIVGGVTGATYRTFQAEAVLATQASVDTIDDLLDTELPALTAAVDALPTNAELATALGTADDAVLAAVAALPTAASIWAAITAAAANLIADHVLRRTTANVEASANGDTLSARSLYGATARLVHKVSISGSTMTTTRSDDSTALTTAALTTDSSADPTTGIDPAA